MDKFKNYLLTITTEYNLKYILLLLLVIIVCLITFFRVKLQIYLGPSWDTYDFLSNALLFAGQGMGYSDLVRPPLLSFITSIFFRIGFVSETVIFIVDGALFIFGVIGLYLLLNYRFNSILSFLGSILYATFPVILHFVGFGLTDIPSVTFSIWAIYFTVLSVKNNSKYFYLVFPFLMLAFLTRFSSAFLIFPIAFYLLINRDFIDIKNIIMGILGSFLLILPVFIFFQVELGNFLYPFLESFSATGSPFSPLNYSYNNNINYFIEEMPLFIGEIIYNIFKIILIILSGIVIYSFIKTTKKSIAEKRTYNFIQSEKFKIIKLALFLVLSFVFIETFGNITYSQSLLLFFILLFVFYELLKSLKIEHFDTDLLIFSFFMTNFIFHSLFVIKVDRYFVIMAPAVAYFLIWGLNEILNFLKLKTQNKNIILSIISIALVFMVLLPISPYLSELKEENQGMRSLTDKSALSSQLLINYDPQYKDKIIYSDIWVYSAWHLKTNIKRMPIFKDGAAYYYGVKNYGISPQDNIAFNQELELGKADYYICVRPELNITSYIPIIRVEDITIYKRSGKN